MSSDLSEVPAFNSGFADMDYSFADEMTVRIVDKDRLPIRNIGVYVNHQER